MIFAPLPFHTVDGEGDFFFRQLFLREGDRIKEGKHYASLHLLSNSLTLAKPPTLSGLPFGALPSVGYQLTFHGESKRQNFP